MGFFFFFLRVRRKTPSCSIMFTTFMHRVVFSHFSHSVDSAPRSIFRFSFYFSLARCLPVASEVRAYHACLYPPLLHVTMIRDYFYGLCEPTSRESSKLSWNHSNPIKTRALISTEDYYSLFFSFHFAAKVQPNLYTLFTVILLVIFGQ